MNYFVTLKHGQTYFYKGVRFDFASEQSVDKEVYDYLTSLVHSEIEVDGSKYKQFDLPIFTSRTEELTETEKVLAEVEDLEEVTLTPRKPGRPKVEK